MSKYGFPRTTLFMEQYISFFLIILLIVATIQIYFYIDTAKAKKKSKEYLEIKYNQLIKEQILRDHYNTEITKYEKIEKEINQKLVTLKTDIVLIDFTLHEIFSTV